MKDGGGTYMSEKACIDPRELRKEKKEDKWCPDCGWLLGVDPKIKCVCQKMEQPDYDYPMTANYQLHMKRIAEERDMEKLIKKIYQRDEEDIIIGHNMIVEKVYANPDGSVSIVMREYDENMSSSDKFLHRFDKRNRELRQLLKDKGSDYSGDEDRHRNFKLVHFITCGKPLVITPLVSCLIRQLDKIQRAFNLLLSGKAHVKGETMKDTLKDNTGYANIAEDVWEVEENEKGI